MEKPNILMKRERSFSESEIFSDEINSSDSKITKAFVISTTQKLDKIDNDTIKYHDGSKVFIKLQDSPKLRNRLFEIVPDDRLEILSENEKEESFLESALV